MMRTRLASFSSDFDATVRPVLVPLQAASEALAAAEERIEDRELLPDLHELHHQLDILVTKVADQQAFLLIFGPLKSGKSTLMNALSAAYVSEVTSLPAYPCMVYVSHAEARGYRLTRYDGKVEELHDATALRMQIQRAHSELSARMREVEAEGHTFDPAVHLPSAIRRLDVRMPAGELAQSGAVLVDTPGLHGRMNFGYERMTREFRNAAACAMFVVKSENLFLEQVFDEFNELLLLFNRIFLVVNVDSTKLDLGPDGSLVPSLEQSDPLRLIEAFENLSMSAQLKQAVDEGRLRIYPVDLLRAASRRLRGEEEDEGETAAHGQAGFDGFLGDLTEFLNSTEYLDAFLNDSLRRARMLLNDAGELCRRPAMKDVLAGLAELEEKLDEARERLAGVRRLDAFAWDDAMATVRQRLAEPFQKRVQELEATTGNALEASIDAWFKNDASLLALLQDELVPTMMGHRADLAACAREELGRSAHLRVPRGIENDLRENGIELDDLVKEARESVASLGEGPQLESPFGPDDVPVKKRIRDWFMLRSMPAVRRQLFGPNAQPLRRIERSEKAARLGEPARRAMEQKLDAVTSTFFRETAQRLPERVLATFESAVRGPIKRKLGAARAELQSTLTALETRISQLVKIREGVQGLERAASSGLVHLSALTARHVAKTSATRGDDVIQPEPRPIGTLPKAARVDGRDAAAPGDSRETHEASANDPFATLERGTTD